MELRRRVEIADVDRRLGLVSCGHRAVGAGSDGNGQGADVSGLLRK